MITLLTAALMGCVAVDGDSLNCSGERIRLVGIDAPEFHCPRNRRCVEGDPQAAKDYLASHLRGKLTIRRLGKDRYGRTIGAVYADGYNLSCEMIWEGHAVYVARWDNSGIVRRDCKR